MIISLFVSYMTVISFIDIDPVNKFVDKKTEYQDLMYMADNRCHIRYVQAIENDKSGLKSFVKLSMISKQEIIDKEHCSDNIDDYFTFATHGNASFVMKTFKSRLQKYDDQDVYVKNIRNRDVKCSNMDLAYESISRMTMIPREDDLYVTVNLNQRVCPEVAGEKYNADINGYEIGMTFKMYSDEEPIYGMIPIAH